MVARRSLRGETPQTFVIVHGAGSGGWLWQGVRRRLQAAGYEVYTPTLTGVGERVHLANPAIDLTVHINDIVGVLTYEDLRDVVLVGHSYGGMVVAGVADKTPERLAHLVYLDAFVPADGQSLMNFAPPPLRAVWEEQARTVGDGWKLPPLPFSHVGQIEAGGLAEAEIQRLLDRRVPQPLQTYTEPVHLMSAVVANLPRSYIHCSDKAADDPFAFIARRLASDPAWRSYAIETGHFPMLTTPRKLVDLLIAIGA